MSHSTRHRTRDYKRSQFQNHQQPNARPKIIIGAASAILVVLIAYVAVHGGATASAVTRITAGPDGTIHIPTANLSNGQTKFFEYTAANSKPVRFFVIKSSDGVYRAAADACDVCYRSKMGYHQEGDDLVCNKCGRHFPSRDVNVITGSCNPDGIPRSVDGNELLIAAGDLEARAVMF